MPPAAVHARFSLDEDTRVTCYQPSSDGKREYDQPVYKRVQGARIKLSAVQGEPFGSASPSGSMEMVIANPVAAEMFKRAELGQEFDVIISPVVPVHPVEAPEPKQA